MHRIRTPQRGAHSVASRRRHGKGWVDGQALPLGCSGVGFEEGGVGPAGREGGDGDEGGEGVVQEVGLLEKTEDPVVVPGEPPQGQWRIMRNGHNGGS